MPSGGKRPGAGRPKGAVSLSKLEARRLICEELLPHVRPVAAAMVASSLGVQHMMARDKDGTWTKVTDPDLMVKVLNSGETFYRIYANNPDTRAAKDILDRLAGSPTQELEITHDLSDELTKAIADGRRRARERKV